MSLIKGEFDRKSPINFFRDTDVPVGWFVISHRWVEGKKNRRLTHGKWHKIISNEDIIYRILRYSINLKGSNRTNKGVIVLDWIGWIDLHGREEDVDHPINLEIKTVKWWELPKCGLSHPDPAYRLATRMAIVSILLGIISVIIALLTI